MDSAPAVLPIQLNASQVRPVAYRVISKKHGLNLKSGALVVLAEVLGRKFGSDWRGPDAEKFLDEICRLWKNEDRGIFVDGDPLQQVITDWASAHMDGRESTKIDVKTYFKVVNAQDQRRLVYSSVSKSFVIPSAKYTLPGLTLFVQRFHILQDKLYRNDLFRPAGFGAEMGGYVIVPIKNMLGKPIGESFFLFGLLEKQTNGPWMLYDPSASIALQFTQETQFAPDHYYPSGSFVLCFGTYLGESFIVGTLGPPQPEPRAASQRAYDGTDFMHTGDSARVERVDPQLTLALTKEEKERPLDRIAVLGCDIWLDDVRGIDALRRCLSTLELNPPAAVIIPGSFISVEYKPHRANSAQGYREAMNVLAECISQCPNLSKQSKFVIVPGENDPWHACARNLLPYQPLPSIFTARVERAGSDINFASNPARIQYFSQEILLFRNNLGDLLRSVSVDTTLTSFQNKGNDDDNMDATDTADIIDAATAAADAADAASNAAGELTTDNTAASSSESTEGSAEPIEGIEQLDISNDRDEEREAEQQAAQTLLNSTSRTIRPSKEANSDTAEARRVFATLLDQSHLSPFIQRAQPVASEYDHVLSMSQWPTVLILLDPTTPAISQQYEECVVLNAGRFLLHDRANWMEYYLNTSACEFRSA